MSGMVEKVEAAKKDIKKHRNILEELYYEAGHNRWTLIQAVLSLTNSIVQFEAFLAEMEKEKG